MAVGNRLRMALSAVVVAGGLVGAAQAQTSSRFPQRDTAIKLMQPITISFDNQRLQDVVSFVRDFTKAEIEGKWLDEKNTDGLDPELRLTLSVEGVSALHLIELVLEEAESEFARSGNSWQFSPTGKLEIGPKERLNKRKRVEIYSIADLLTEVPDYLDAPQFDLNQILQSGGGGGGGGQSPFQQSGGGNQSGFDIPPIEERADEIKQIIIDLVESDQWSDNGGPGGTIRYWQGNFIVNAPDYMHRQLNGYPWWPARATRVSSVNGRRYVSLNMDANFASIEGFENQPISAVVGGKIVSSDDPPGGGG